jgi:hypothetical protein
MTETVTPVFLRLPQQGAIVGRLLAGYGEIEFELANVLKRFTHNMHSAFAAIFRVRSESGRIDIADAIIRSAISSKGLGPKWEKAIGAVRQCLKIRNQYAHCHWLEENNELIFTMLADAFDGPKAKPLTVRVALLSTLQDQESYFRYTVRCLSHLEWEYARLIGAAGDHPFEWPKERQPPILHTQRTWLPRPTAVDPENQN